MCVLSEKDLGRDIYDIYAEYEDEGPEDGLGVSHCHLMLSSTKHLNLNVGGTVILLEGDVRGPPVLVFSRLHRGC